jgi:hypothetical protein
LQRLTAARCFFVPRTVRARLRHAWRPLSFGFVFAFLPSTAD